MGGILRRAFAVLAAAVVGALVWAAPAVAYEFTRPLRAGDTGRDVRVLQVRVAGWYPNDDQNAFILDGDFGKKTTIAVRNFQRHYGLTADGVAGKATFSRLARLQDGDGSTEHFDWSEFDQNYNPGCSAQANAYAGTFGGGMVSAKRARRNARRLMWRLEAIRAKGGSNPIGINSGFRSVRYNDCIGGARLSQHQYGTAADNRMARVDNHRERKIAMRSQVHGIGCYTSQTHNHFDLRINNAALREARFWWWPEVDSRGRHLSDEGRPCWGETTRTRATVTTAGVLRAVEMAVPGEGSLVPSVEEIEAFESAGEPDDLLGAD